MVRLPTTIAFTLLAVGLSACADSVTRPSDPINPTITDDPNNGPGLSLGETRVCKAVNGTGAPQETFGFTYAFDAGTPVAFNVAGGSCYSFTTPTTGTFLVTIIEDTPPANWALTEINTIRVGGPGYTATEDVPNRTATVYNNRDIARQVTFTNTYTPPVVEGCTYTQGYWKTHAGAKKQADAWPAGATSGGLTLGSVDYGKDQLLRIMNAPTKGNGLISLGTQLIAAKLNVYPGTTADIDAADALIGALVIPPIGSGYLSPEVTSVLNTALTNFNQGVTGPGHCDDEVID